MLALTIWLGYFAERSDFVPFIGAYGLFFGLYALLVLWIKPTGAELRWYVGLGIALRVALVFSLPNFSDDYHRFLWDGRLLAQGINPFSHPPDYFMEHPGLATGLTPELFSRLNSPHYFTVYPPVCQAVFALAGWLFPANDRAGVVVMKLFLLGCEVGTIGVLGAIGKSLGIHSDAGPTLLYALNPLILLEIMGNCHFEGAMICFLLVGMAALQRGHLVTGALGWALATAAKLLPPLFLPLVWRWLGWRRGFVFVLIFSGITAALFAPMLQPEVLANMSSSLGLYFRQFEFNASLYYLVKSAGRFFTEREIGRMVGPVLGLLTGVAVLGLALFRLRWNAPMPRLAEAMTLASGIYLFDATTVHPWYAAVPFALSLGTGWRWPLLWSGLAALSYSHYAEGRFQENFGLIAVEYSALWAFLLWEILRPLSLSNSPPRNNPPGS